MAQADSDGATPTKTIRLRPGLRAEIERLARRARRSFSEVTEAQASKQAGEAKGKSEQMIKDLKAKRAKVSSKFNDLSKATKNSWDETKKGFADAYRDLATSYDKAVAAFKQWPLARASFPCRPPRPGRRRPL